VRTARGRLTHILAVAASVPPVVATLVNMSEHGTTGDHMATASMASASASAGDDKYMVKESKHIKKLKVGLILPYFLLKRITVILRATEP